MTNRKETNYPMNELDFLALGAFIRAQDKALAEKGDCTSEEAIANCVLNHVYTHSTPQTILDNLRDAFESVEIVDFDVIHAQYKDRLDEIGKAMDEYASRMVRNCYEDSVENSEAQEKTLAGWMDRLTQDDFIAYDPAEVYPKYCAYAVANGQKPMKAEEFIEAVNDRFKLEIDNFGYCSFQPQ